MQLSKIEQELFNQKRKSIAARKVKQSSKEPSQQNQIENYPGRAVTVKCAQERLRTFPDMDMHSACTTPKMVPKPGSKRV